MVGIVQPAGDAGRRYGAVTTSSGQLIPGSYVQSVKFNTQPHDRH